MRHDLPVYERCRRHGAPGRARVWFEELGRFGDAARGPRFAGETPAFREYPADVLERIAEGREFPIEHAGEPAFVHEVIAGAVVAVDEGDFLFVWRVNFAPAQAPLERRMRVGESIEILPVMGDVVARPHGGEKGEPG